jgi:hypothetical protein
MAPPKSGSNANERDAGSWASETLPLSIRRELLDRELARLGFGKASQHGTGTQQQQQQQQQSQGSHPQAGDPDAGEHSE